MGDRFPDDKICEGEHLVRLLEIGPGIFAEPPAGISCISLETVRLSGDDACSRIRVRFQDTGDSAGLYTGRTQEVQIKKLIPEDCFMLTNPDPKFMMHGAPVHHGSPLAVMFRTKDRYINIFYFLIALILCPGFLCTLMNFGSSQIHLLKPFCSQAKLLSRYWYLGITSSRGTRKMAPPLGM